MVGRNSVVGTEVDHIVVEVEEHNNHFEQEEERIAVDFEVNKTYFYQERRKNKIKKTKKNFPVINTFERSFFPVY